jgi:hypothetical protein
MTKFQGKKQMGLAIWKLKIGIYLELGTCDLEIQIPNFI